MLLKLHNVTLTLWHGLVIILIVTSVSCIDNFWPEIDKYENALVIDGLLTNEQDAPIIRLSYSGSLLEETPLPVSGAAVSITVNESVDFDLVEVEPGYYTLLDNSFTSEVGNSYQLKIILENGNKYNSDICILRQPSPIDSIYGLKEERDGGDLLHDIVGLQFFIDNHSVSCDTCYYMWKLSQAYKYQASFSLDYLWAGEYIPFPSPDSLRVCYHTSKLDEVYIGTTKYLNEPKIIGQALNYVTTETKELSIRYSLEVRQLSVSSEVYNFFDAIEQQNIEQGDMYSKQPIQIRGNVSNINNPEEPVLGFFIVAGETKKRIFIDRPGIPYYYVECTPDYDLRDLRFTPPSYWPIYLTDIMFTGLAMGQSNSCFDCRLDGGSLTPPEYWVE